MQQDSYGDGAVIFMMVTYCFLRSLKYKFLNVNGFCVVILISKTDFNSRETTLRLDSLDKT